MTATGVLVSGRPRRTAPVGVALSALTGLRKSIAGLAALAFVMRDHSEVVFIGLAALGAVLIGNVAFALLRWHRFTFTIGADALRVESGVLSRSSRSVPYARIHDINLEQGPIARIFGLMKVTFDTGAGGEENVSLAYLASRDGEDLRTLVRARKDAVAAPVPAYDGGSAAEGESSSVLFAMDRRRVVTFGVFEFSLAAIAVLFGITQQFEFLLPFDLWDWQGWQQRLATQAEWLSGLGKTLQVLGAVIAVASLMVVGVATGVTRTVLREWNFLLELTERGFRRRRGLLTRTDVVMPVHRVQAMRMSTRLLRRRFGWHRLTFLSLAQDAGARSHVVAPFGRPHELWPIARAAGFDAPDTATTWQRLSPQYRRDRTILAAAVPVPGLIAALALGEPLLAMAALAIGAVLAAERWFSWRHTEHAMHRRQILSRRGWLVPRLTIAPRVKLQSMEIRQGPLGRLHGYGTVHLGIAGGTMSIPGIRLEDLVTMRRALAESMSEMDFGELDRKASTPRLPTECANALASGVAEAVDGDRPAI